MTLAQTKTPSSLRSSTRLLMLGGSLAAVYAGFLSTPLTAAFYKENGTAGHRFGLITGIPMLMLSMHFIAALISHRLVRRKPTFIIVSIFQRLLFLPIAFLPMVFPDLSPESMIIIIGIILGVNAGATNFRLTLINSWFADLIPHRILNRFWGHRQAWMSIMIVSCYLLVAVFTFFVDWSVTAKFQILVVVATIAGLIDTLLHLGIHEPVHEVVRDEHPFRLLTEPIRCKTYRSFLLFQSVWFGSAVIAGAFMVVYTLEVLNVRPAVATLIWTLQIVGPILASRWWGRLADRHGHRPLLAICHTLKPSIALTFFLVTPETALWVLPPVILLDGTLNAGLGVATNGYSMKMAPKKNRAMFLAASAGLAGIVGGIMALVAGGVLKHLDGWSVEFAGRTWINYHVLFGTSVILRLLCNIWVRRIREPDSSRPIHVLRNLFPIRAWGWLRPPAVTDEDVVEDMYPAGESE
jgi:MFS family permease